MRTRNQRGIALIVALVLLLAVTLLALSGLRTGRIEERLSVATQDRALAFQAAEAALRHAEGLIPALRATPGAIPSDLPSGQYDDETCHVSACNENGICARPDGACTPRWENPSFNGWVNGPTVTAGSQSVTPQYYIEVTGRDTPCESRVTQQDLQGTCTTFRITARAQPSADRAFVMLQSTFIWPN
ncbi:PilX N-terminal domain-containing pilus assembly protein [Tepidimonas taiwanensis]|uniref:pilus assembly PilX family protein n=1 Tax=Tepidimonas taiwanensis TaxID=307486 RepID=UPI0009EB57E6|nr:pilus assembly protein [Tepidimonas taiwanensis]